MKPFFLVETTTKDGLIHQGIYFEPKKKSKRAILWIHGLTGRFYGDTVMMNELAEASGKQGYGFAAFNTRGHDMVASIHKKDTRKPSGHSYLTRGAAYEKFEESVFDIDAGITFLVNKGFSEVIVIGYSTGANKACYFFAKERNPHAVGVVLAGPISDRLDVDIDQKKLKKDLEKMQKLVQAGKGDELSAFHQFPMTPKRFISLLGTHTAEDTFDYGDKIPKLTSFSAITKPLLVIIGAVDEYADRPVADIIKTFDRYQRSRNYKSVLLPGCAHGFEPKEKEAVESMIKWIKSI